MLVNRKKDFYNHHLRFNSKKLNIRKKQNWITICSSSINISIINLLMWSVYLYIEDIDNYIWSCSAILKLKLCHCLYWLRISSLHGIYPTSSSWFCFLKKLNIDVHNGRMRQYLLRLFATINVIDNELELPPGCLSSNDRFITYLSSQAPSRQIFKCCSSSSSSPHHPIMRY